MKVEIHSDNSTANSLTDRLGARQRTKHIDTLYFWIPLRPHALRQHRAHVSTVRMPGRSTWLDMFAKTRSAVLMGLVSLVRRRFFHVLVLHCTMRGRVRWLTREVLFWCAVMCKAEARLALADGSMEWSCQKCTSAHSGNVMRFVEEPNKDFTERSGEGGQQR